jgi:hypothetical protein
MGQSVRYARSKKEKVGWVEREGGNSWWERVRPGQLVALGSKVTKTLDAKGYIRR